MEEKEDRGSMCSGCQPHRLTGYPQRGQILPPALIGYAAPKPGLVCYIYPVGPWWPAAWFYK